MSSNKRLKFRGTSGRSCISPSVTEHTVSHEMIIDKKYWDLRIAESGKEDRSKSYFSAIKKNRIVSQLFTALDDGDVYWRIRVDRDASENTMFKVSVDMETEVKDIDVLVQAWIKHDLDAPFRKKDPQKSYHVMIDTKNPSGVCFQNTVLEEGFKAFRVDLTYAKVKKFDEESSLVQISQKIQPNEATVQPQKRTIARDIGVLLKNTSSSDITLKANGREWKVHKCILAARSDVFAAMFESNMRENHEGVVNIQDVNCKALDLMIKFIYNDDIDDSDIQVLEDAVNLLCLSDRYYLPALKEKCEKQLLSQLTVENSLRLFMIGNKYNAPLLQASAKNILSLNLSEICRTREFKRFTRENLELSIELMQVALPKK